MTAFARSKALQIDLAKGAWRDVATLKPIHLAMGYNGDVDRQLGRRAFP